MIGILNNTITIQQLYDYALKHDYLGADVNVVLDIISRERQKENETVLLCSDKNNLVTPTDNTSTIDFSKIKHYTVEDLLNLLG